MTDTHADTAAHGHGGPHHQYHLVDPSPWPLVGSIVAGLLTGGAVMWMHRHGALVMILGAIGVLATMSVLWLVVLLVATFLGFHTPIVQLGLRYVMALFISS